MAKLFILHLGTLLCELFAGKKVTVTDEDREEDEDEDNGNNDSLFNALSRECDGLKELPLSKEYYLKVIDECLDLYSDATVINRAFRSSFYWKIVAPLRKSLVNHTRPSTHTSRPSFRDRTDFQQRPVARIETEFRNISTLKRQSKSNSPNEIIHQHKRPKTAHPYILFDVDSQAYQERMAPDRRTAEFIRYMEMFLEDRILPLPTTAMGGIEPKAQKVDIRIAVLDTGIYFNEEDTLLEGGKDRIIEKRSFLSKNQHLWIDSYGHGTHIVRLLLRFAPRADIIVAKISESKESIGIGPIIEALEWVSHPDCGADIIVMSFKLGQAPIPVLQALISNLVRQNKLIFASASNSGGNEERAFPAREPGAFAIHVSDGHAAAIAANALEFIKHTLTKEGDNPGYFYNYQGMEALFDCLSNERDRYNYVKPWRKYLWHRDTKDEETYYALKAIAMYGPKNWKAMASERSFQGFRHHYTYYKMS
ncbi:subtilisin-like protein [Daldinia eschscholtzii]|nr:subtilisin-like protein [Daldinia eschscholtzii]